MDEPEDIVEAADAEQEPEGPRRRRGVDEDDDASRRKRLLLLVPLVTVAAVGSSATLVFLQGQGTYSKPVDTLVAQKAAYVGKPVRAEGMLVHGSLTKGEDGCDHRFTIAKSDSEMRVRFPSCVVPDSLVDVPSIDLEVTVEGNLEADGSLAATRVFTKCPSRYEKEQRIARGEKAPH